MSKQESQSSCLHMSDFQVLAYGIPHPRAPPLLVVSKDSLSVLNMTRKYNNSRRGRKESGMDPVRGSCHRQEMGAAPETCFLSNAVLYPQVTQLASALILSTGVSLDGVVMS